MVNALCQELDQNFRCLLWLIDYHLPPSYLLRWSTRSSCILLTLKGRVLVSSVFGSGVNFQTVAGSGKDEEEMAGNQTGNLGLSVSSQLFPCEPGLLDRQGCPPAHSSPVVRGRETNTI